MKSYYRQMEMRLSISSCLGIQENVKTEVRMDISRNLYYKVSGPNIEIRNTVKGEITKEKESANN